ncbi:MAG: hypothetical protein ACE5JX_09370 [Acidobacteriota bacterium]
MKMSLKRSLSVISFTMLSAMTAVSHGSAQHRHGSSTVSTPAGTKIMSSHLLMTERRPVVESDIQQAEKLKKRLQEVLVPFQDYRYAEKEGYKAFLPNLPLKEYHFNNRRYGMRAASGFDIDHPTSLLYKKKGSGYRLVGVMYTAPPWMSVDELDRRVPLSLADWHQHVNVCLAPQGAGPRASLGRNARFGPRGSISTPEACRQAGGRWNARLFGWMVHVYPFEQTMEKVFQPMAAHRDSHHSH